MSVSASGPRQSPVHPLTAGRSRALGHPVRLEALQVSRQTLPEDLVADELAPGLGED